MIVICVASTIPVSLKDNCYYRLGVRQTTARASALRVEAAEIVTRNVSKRKSFVETQASRKCRP